MANETFTLLIQKQADRLTEEKLNHKPRVTFHMGRGKFYVFKEPHWRAVACSLVSYQQWRQEKFEPSPPREVNSFFFDA